MISDTQRAYDETAAAIRAINAMPEVDFVVHGGDFTQFGATREFEWQRDLMEKLRVPWIGVIGNHDCLGSGVDV